jgi:hypothetical protein
LPASANSSEDPRSNIFAEADTNRNWRQGGMSINAPLDQNPQYTEILQQSQNLGNGPTAASSSSPLKPGEIRYRCSICGLDFKQKRGVTRHHRDVHEVSLCFHCSGFEWHRRHELKNHLEEQHPDIHVPAALAEATRYRRRATMIKKQPTGTTSFPSRH